MTQLEKTQSQKAYSIEGEGEVPRVTFMHSSVSTQKGLLFKNQQVQNRFEQIKMRRENQELPKPHYRHNSVEVHAMNKAIRQSSLGSIGTDYTSRLASGGKASTLE
jgi:hypothetical protein